MSGRREQPDGPQALVVGAGPVGLTAAHELARRGLRVRLVDGAHGPARTSRAVATHPRTLETYDQMGIVDAMLPRGRRNRAFTMFAKGRRLVRLEADYRTMPTSYPFTLIVGQTETESVLRDAVARLGVTVEWGHRLTGFEQHEDGVRVRLIGPDGAVEEVTAGWLVGCDGGHSTVRKLLGLELAGDTSETWMLADAPVTTDLPPDTIYWAHTGSQAMMMVPYAQEGQWRLLDTAPAKDSAQRSEDAFAAKLSAGLGRDVRVGDAAWTSVFTFQQRMVEHMQQGRVFVAGDAAHVHSPASGQGMNTGIQEAYNLAWKLAQVEQGHAVRELLDTYSQERVPIGRALLGSTRTATFLVQLRNLLASVVLPVVFTVVRNAPPLRRKIQRKVLGGMSGLRIGYPDSSLTDASEPPRRATGPQPGERVTAAAVHDPEDPGCTWLRTELRDPRWSLLHAADGTGPGDIPEVAAVTAAVEYGAWLSVRTVGGATGPHPLGDPAGLLRAGLGLRPGGWVLIRPDGYVAARGAALSPGALRRALKGVVPQRPSSAPGGPASPDTQPTHLHRTEVDVVEGAVT